MVEPEYWASFRAGDEQVFNEMYNRYGGMLFSYGMKIVRDEDIVRECIQSLFIYMFDHRKSMPVPRNLTSYLIVSLRHLLYKPKNQGVRLPFLRYDQVGKNEVFNLAIDIQESLEHSDELQEEQLHSLQAALDALSPQQREVIYLRYYKNLSVDEVADVIGINRQTVKNVACTALARLRRDNTLSKAFLTLLELVVLKHITDITI